ncbi:hypothetical protein [Streptomyces albipurpureus]|uniref:Uncharacterized protein n=1 Tax=Streptomyces albipurpureus TaxID=2897419 RepID=A0ABT0UNA3_9ACTN|nr:hypothetical protein [Streptomyces sp. CWNU-1]MCM2389924.1 hypothetical protein [Streptomyces sp. CWNU-1]
MPLTWITLASGRGIELLALRLSQTYGGLLEGPPFKEVNDRKLTRLVENNSEFSPALLVTPTREYPDVRPGSMGPVELLPAVTCIGSFRSHPIDPSYDLSLLTVIWFQAAASLPEGDNADPGLLAIDWEAASRDCSY